jgi:hypothetical protein
MQDLLDDITSAVGPVSILSPELVLVKWNVTWTPPKATWLLSVAKAWPGGAQVVSRPYNHWSGEVSTFRWGSVFRLFSNLEGRKTYSTTGLH